MALQRVPRSEFGKPEFKVSIRAVVESIREARTKLKTPIEELRQITSQGFFKIFALLETGTNKKGLPTYGLSVRDIADETGYSPAMVGHYRTLYENKDKVVTVGINPGKEEIDAETGDILREEPTPVTAKVSDMIAKSEIADLSALVRRHNRGEAQAKEGRPADTPETKGRKFGMRLSAMPNEERTAYLTGVARALAETGVIKEALQFLNAAQAHAGRRSKTAPEATA